MLQMRRRHKHFSLSDAYVCQEAEVSFAEVGEEVLVAKVGRGGAVAVVVVVHVAGVSALAMSVKACCNCGGGKNHFALDVCRVCTSGSRSWSF